MKNLTLADFTVTDDGRWEDPDGITQGDDACEALQCGILDFCGCGAPEDSLDFVRVGLQLIADLKLLDREPSAWNEAYGAWKAKADEHHGSRGAKYFFWYWCDSEKLTEHGGSVPGWLTDRGKQLLADLGSALTAKSSQE